MANYLAMNRDELTAEKAALEAKYKEFQAKGPFYVNAAWWNGLPEEYRDIITECATKMGEYNDELIDKNSSAAKQTIVDYGCEVYEPSADELKAFQTAVQSVYDQCVTEGICTADEIKEMQDIVAKA